MPSPQSLAKVTVSCVCGGSLGPCLVWRFPPFFYIKVACAASTQPSATASALGISVSDLRLLFLGRSGSGKCLGDEPISVVAAGHFRHTTPLTVAPSGLPLCPQEPVEACEGEIASECLLSVEPGTPVFSGQSPSTLGWYEFVENSPAYHFNGGGF